MQTRWYRAPELLVGAAYGFEVDIWAVGEIRALYVMGRRVSQPGCQLNEGFGFLVLGLEYGPITTPLPLPLPRMHCRRDGHLPTALPRQEPHGPAEGVE